MNQEELKQYIYSSISDIRSTIRAIDTKISALTVIITFPLSNAPNIVNSIIDFYNYISFKCLTIPVIFLFIISWVLSIFIAIKGLSAIDNPAKHILRKEFNFKLNYLPPLQENYYSGYLYNFKFKDAICNRKDLKSSIDFETYYSNFLQITINKELIFEQMKLVYIRDIKLHRLKFVIYFIFFWLFAGAVIYLGSRCDLLEELFKTNTIC